MTPVREKRTVKISWAEGLYADVSILAVRKALDP
jgi:hypothetical protein